MNPTSEVGQQAAEELGPWLWLSNLSYVGPAVFRALLDVFETPHGVRDADGKHVEHVLASTDGIRKSVWSRALKSLRAADQESYTQAMRDAETQVAACREVGARILTLDDPLYPALLSRQENVAPPVLYARGELDVGTSKGLALVGTRSATSDGLRAVRTFASDAAQRGWTIVSGAAAGTDRAAHEGALAVDGPTLAVLGCGVDRVYPRTNKDLFEQLWTKGLVVSEYPPGTRPSGTRLKKRNKITVGAADCVVMGECPASSGTLNAARSAEEQDKPVFVLPMEDRQDEKMAGAFRLVAWGKAHELKTEGVSELERRLGEPPTADRLIPLIKKKWPVLKGLNTREQLSPQIQKAWTNAFSAWKLEADGTTGFSEGLEELGEQIVLQQERSWRRLRGACQSLLLDLDGVVVAVHNLLARTLQDVLTERLKDEAPSISDVQQLLGSHPRDILQDYLSGDSDGAIQRFQKLYFSRYQREAQSVSETITVLTNLRRSGVGIGLVTTQPRSRASAVLDRLQCATLFDTIITWNDVGQPKPHPSGLEKAMSELGAEQASACYVGDGRVDFEAARRADLPAIAACWDREFGPGVIAGKPDLFLVRPAQLCQLVNASVQETTR